MKSPFPGMDPFLERHWDDVHTRFCVYVCDAIDEGLPRELRARVEKSLRIEAEWEDPVRVRPDVIVSEEQDAGGVAVAAPPEVAVAQPLVIPLLDEPPYQRYIEIIEPGAGDRLVTVIELLSPANKASKLGREFYREKQESYLGNVNLVEIDLIRRGSYVLAAPQEQLPRKFQNSYLISVVRPKHPLNAEVYPCSMWEPLPTIAIPLRPADADLPLSLQPLLDECYRKGRYGETDYTAPLTPELSEEDRRRLTEVLACRRTKGSRLET